MTSYKKKVISSAFWTVISQILSLGVVLISNIFLARLLSPEDFGKLGIVMTFIAIANVFSNSGLLGALIRQKKTSKEDFSTVFVFNMVVSIAFCLIFTLISGFVADYYRDSQLQALLIACSSIIIISTFQVVQNVRLMIDMRFKEKSIAMLTSSVVGALTGILLAYLFDIGVWALVAIPVSSNIILAIMYWYYDGFFFDVTFSKTSFRNMYAFGVNTTLTTILNIIFDNVYQLVLGRMFSLHEVGFYYQAKKLQDVPTAIVNNLSQGVIYSALAKVQDNKGILLNVYKNMIRMFTSFLGLAALMMFAFAPFIVTFLFGAKWIESAFYLQLLSIIGFFYSQELINKVIFKIYNQTHTLLRLELIKKIIHAFTIVIGVYIHSIEVLLAGFAFTSLVSYLLNYYSTKSIMQNPNNFEQLLVFKVLCVGAICYFLKTGIVLLGVNNDYLLIPIVILLYLVLIHVFKILKLNQIKQLINLSKG